MQAINDVLDIKKTIENEYHQKFNQYQYILTKYYPDYLNPVNRLDKEDIIDLTEEEKLDYLAFLQKDDYFPYKYQDYLHNPRSLYELDFSILSEENQKFMATFDKILNLKEKLQDIDKEQNIDYLQSLIDKKIKFINEDVIITDPVYLIKEKDWLIKWPDLNYIYNPTLLGDWTCRIVFNNKEIGTFTADAGLVGVFSYKEFLEYNPLSIQNLKSHQYTIIYNYSENISINIDYENYEFKVKINGNNFHSELISI